MVPGEQILVVARARLLDHPIHGFTTRDLGEYLSRIHLHSMFRPRGEVERDPSLKQIIPYLLVRHDSRIFLFQRSSVGGEDRLHGKYSIGVGGHINRSDTEDAADLIAAGLRRELEEELVIEGHWRSRIVGVLNDDRNPVGQVHFGLVHVIELDTPAIRVRESHSLSGRLVDPQEVQALRDSMETWSQMILDAADPMAL